MISLHELNHPWSLAEDVFLTTQEDRKVKVIVVKENETELFLVEGLIAEVLTALKTGRTVNELISGIDGSVLDDPRSRKRILQVLSELKNLRIIAPQKENSL